MNSRVSSKLIPQKIRASNFELLRIVCMFMIIGLHLFKKGGALESLSVGDKNYYITNGLESLFIVAVNCYVLISGYFKINFNIEKLLKLTHEVWFYAIVIFIIFLLGDFGYVFKVTDCIRILFPIIFHQWWFISTYVVLYFCAPFLNTLVENLSRSKFEKLLILLFILLCFLPTFNICPVKNSSGFSLYFFGFLYLIGRYINIYTVQANNKYLFLAGYFVCSILCFTGNLTLTIFSENNSLMFYGYDTIFTFLGSILLFMFFKELNIKSLIINSVSPLVLSVYIIHEHPRVREYIWQDLLHCKEWIYSPLFLLYTLIVMICIFVMCTAAEYLRRLLLGGFEEKLIKCEIKSGKIFCGFLIKQYAGVINIKSRL